VSRRQIAHANQGDFRVTSPEFTPESCPGGSLTNCVSEDWPRKQVAGVGKLVEGRENDSRCLHGIPCKRDQRRASQHSPRDRPFGSGGDAGWWLRQFRPEVGGAALRVSHAGTSCTHAPIGAVELRAFKEKPGEQQQRCRVHLDARLADLTAVDDVRLRDVKAEEVMHEVRDEVISLQERMQKKRWPKVALVGLGGVIGAVLATAAVVVSWGSALAMGLGVGAGALQVSAAGNSFGANETASPRQARPLVYAALAGRL